MKPEQGYLRCSDFALSYVHIGEELRGNRDSRECLQFRANNSPVKDRLRGTASMLPSIPVSRLPTLLANGSRLPFCVFRGSLDRQSHIPF
jgi:hypothetical protein